MIDRKHCLAMVLRICRRSRHQVRGDNLKPLIHVAPNEAPRFRVQGLFRIVLDFLQS